MNRIAEIEELKALIFEGNKLKKLPESNNVFEASRPSGLVVPITSQMDNWINTSIRLIYSLLSKTIIDSDFTEIANIYKVCVDKSQVITSNRKQNINKILTALGACLSFCEWFIVFEQEKLSVKQKAEYYFCSLEAIVQYIHTELTSSLIRLEDGRTKKTVLLHLYGRIFLLGLSIVKLNDFKDCQLLGASLRSLLELYIDMQLIRNDTIGNGINKFFSFPEIYKFNSAKKTMKIDEEIQRPIAESSVLIKIVQNSEQINQKALSLWRKKLNEIPHGHWSELSLEHRCRKVNELEFFRHVYYYGNMYIHSGYLQFPITEADAYVLCVHVYSLASEIFKKSTDLLLNEIDIAPKKEIIQELERIYLCFGGFQIWKSLIAALRANPAEAGNPS